MMLHALCSYISSRGTGGSSTSFAASTADANWSRVLFLSVKTLESSVAVIYHSSDLSQVAMHACSNGQSLLGCTQSNSRLLHAPCQKSPETCN